jgi:hypothetical protein
MTSGFKAVPLCRGMAGLPFQKIDELTRIETLNISTGQENTLQKKPV